MTSISQRARNMFILSGLLALTFLLWTAGVLYFDVQPVGPKQSTVGFGALNNMIFTKVGTSNLFDKIGDAILLLTIADCFLLLFFALRQGVKRRGIKQISSYFWYMALIYAAIGSLYIIFNFIVVSYRPILEDGQLVASFPSSHTMAVITVMGCTFICIRHLTRSRKIINLVSIGCIACMIAMPVSRLMAGVHWFSDIVAAVLLGATLVALYAALVETKRPRKAPRHAIGRAHH